MREPQKGLGLFGACASGFAWLEGRPGRGSWMSRPPDMHDEAHQHECDQEELVKQQIRSHDNVPFPDGERRLLYRIDSFSNYPLATGTGPTRRGT